jgi:Prenyltransferase and squalene oxidase repeat
MFRRRWAETMMVPVKVRSWLSSPTADPSVRARYWTEVEGAPPTDPRVRAARRRIGADGWAARLLRFQCPDGHWTTPGTEPDELYIPKYVASNWVAIVLSELGMTRSDRRIRATAELFLDRWARRRQPLSTGAEVCVTGNMVRTLVRFGYLDHPTVVQAIDWLVRAQKSDGGWHCFPSRTGTLDGWEGLAAFAEIPESERDGRVRRSIELGAEFFLRRRLMKEDAVRYPPWFRIHFPNHYYYDLLVGLRTLAKLGYGGDPRMEPALGWLRDKRNPDGTWSLDAAHPDVDAQLSDYRPRPVVFPMVLELPGVPSRWATVDALGVLARVETARRASA